MLGSIQNKEKRYRIARIFWLEFLNVQKNATFSGHDPLLYETVHFYSYL